MRAIEILDEPERRRLIQHSYRPNNPIPDARSAQVAGGSNASGGRRALKERNLACFMPSVPTAAKPKVTPGHPRRPSAGGANCLCRTMLTILESARIRPSAALGRSAVFETMP